MSELHDLPLEIFQREVRSVSFWLDAVRDYLPSEDGRPLPPDDVPEDERDALVTVLCSYCVGETAALEGAGGLIRIAPNRESKIFLSTQVVDEGRHLEILAQRMTELGVTDVDAEVERRGNPVLQQFRRRLLGLVDEGRWECALFAQNVILEAMEFAAFHHHMTRADARTRAILEGVVKDERRHIGFGENELGRELQRDPDLRGDLERVRIELDPLVLGTFEHTMGELRVEAAERPEIRKSYLESVRRMGFA